MNESFEEKNLIHLINWAKQNKKSLQIRRQFHVAAIYQRKRLISLAINTDKTHPAMKPWYPYFPGLGTHAELNAILQAEKIDFSKSTLYVIRIDNNGNVADSKPCCYCQKMIESFQFYKVIHS